MNIACDSCKQVGTSTKLRSYSYLPTVYLPVSLENSFKYDTVPGRQLGLNLIRVGTPIELCCPNQSFFKRH